MAFDTPKLTDQVDVAIATKTADGLLALRDGSAIVGVGGGTANAQTVTTTTAFASLTNGLRISYKPIVTNTSTTSLTVDVFVAKNVAKQHGTGYVNIGPGDLVLNIQADLIYVTQNDHYILLNPATVMHEDRANVISAANGLKRKDVADRFGFQLFKRAAETYGISTNLNDDLTQENAALNSWDLVFNVLNSTVDLAYKPAAGTRVGVFSIDSTGEVTAGIVSVSRIRRTEVDANNVANATVTTTVTDILTGLDLGTVNVGDRVLVNVLLNGVDKVTTDDFVEISAIKDSGTGVGLFSNQFISLTSQPYMRAVQNSFSMSGIFHITTAGTLKLKVTGRCGSGTMSVLSGLCGMSALVLNDG